jgi:hypothetical protein
VALGATDHSLVDADALENWDHAVLVAYTVVTWPVALLPMFCRTLVEVFLVGCRYRVCLDDGGAFQSEKAKVLEMRMVFVPDACDCEDRSAEASPWPTV